jgi:hypothetical protein
LIALNDSSCQPPSISFISNFAENLFYHLDAIHCRFQFPCSILTSLVTSLLRQDFCILTLSPPEVGTQRTPSIEIMTCTCHLLQVLPLLWSLLTQRTYQH